MIKRALLVVVAAGMLLGVVNGVVQNPGTLAPTLLSFSLWVYLIWRAWPAVRADLERLRPGKHAGRRAARAGGLL